MVDLLQEIVLEYLARVPLKSIARFRSCNKEWRSLIDSELQDKFISRHSSSSVSWSIIQLQPHKLTLEIISHHGCETWGLPRSPGSFVSFLVETPITKLLVKACTDGLVLIYVEGSDGTPMYYVGNTMSREWYRIPLPPGLDSRNLVRLQKYCERFSDGGLVTKMQRGTVVSYKVVWVLTREDDKVEFLVYSSDTGTWVARILPCLDTELWFGRHKSIALNGILHWIHDGIYGFAAYDFYGGHDDDECSTVEFPDTLDAGFLKTSEGSRVYVKDLASRHFRRTITTSEGSLVYFNEFGRNRNRTLRVWRLLTYTEVPQPWELFWNIRLEFLMDLGIEYFPVVMHPLNSDIIYLWSKWCRMLIMFNLRTRSVILQAETAYDSECMDGLILSFNWCSEYMMEPSVPFGPNHLLFSQFVLPRFLQRLPRPNALPPQVNDLRSTVSNSSLLTLLDL